MRPSSTARFVLILLLLVPSLASAQWGLRDVVWTATPVQDSGGNTLVFDTFYYANTTVSASGRLQFAASARDPQDPEFSGPFSCWLELDGGGFEKLFAAGEPLPGHPELVVSTSFYGRIEQGQEGTVLLSSQFNEGTYPPDSGLYLHTGGVWQELVSFGDPVARPWDFDQSPLTVYPGDGPFHGEKAAFMGLLYDQYGNDISQSGLFVAELGQPLRELLRVRQDFMPDLPGQYRVEAVPGMPEAVSPFMEMNRAGQIAFTAHGESFLDGSAARALYRSTPEGGINALFSETGPTVYALTTSITHLRINAPGQVAVAGVLANLGEGVWVFDGPLQTRQVLDFTQFNTTDNLRVKEVSAMVLTDDGRVVVHGVAESILGNDYEGIWTETEGSADLSPVVVIGDPIPGMPGKVFGGVHGISGTTVNADGLVAFTAGIREDGQPDQIDDPNGLWIGNEERVDLVVQTGDLVEYDSGSVARADIINLPGSAYGQIVAGAAFGSGSGGWGTPFGASGELGFSILSPAGPVMVVAHRALVVNTSSDLSDAVPGDGVCDTGVFLPDGRPECSLRAAIEEANAAPERQRVEFDIPFTDPGYQPAKGVWILRPDTELPKIVHPIDLRGQDPVDALGPPEIHLEGSYAGLDATGLTLDPGAVGSTIRGLILGNWGLDGVHLGAEFSTLSGCYVGADPEGDVMGNGRHGVLVTATGVEVGGALAPRNVITNNARHGVAIEGAQVTGVLVANSQIGASAEPQFPSGNGGAGVFIDAARGCLIGGEDPGAANLIGRNAGNGITIQRRARHNLVVGNLIGTASNGFTDLANGRHGVYVDDSPRCRIEGNTIAFHDDDGDAGILGSESVKLHVLHNEITQNETGISMWRCNQDFVSRNFIHYNQCGVDVNQTLRVSFTLNRIENNLDNTCTGLHAYGSSVDIVGNRFTGDAGNGISMEDGSSGRIHQNLIFDNQGSGVENFDPSASVDASGNWWGDASGPGGEGPGAGDEVGGNVDFSSWTSEPIALVATADADTLYIPPGEFEVLRLQLRNWSNPSDVVDLSLSDDWAWVLADPMSSLALAMDGSAEFEAIVAVPSGVSAKMENLITVDVASQSDPAQSIQFSVVVVPYVPVLESIVLAPDSLQLAPGASRELVATGLDQRGRGMDFVASWESSGGSIDAAGRYTAGQDLGSYLVTVSGPGGAPQATARVEIVEISLELGDPEDQPGEDPVIELPSRLTLTQNYPNPFNPRTTIRFGLPRDERVDLEVFDLRGRLVRRLISGEVLSAGYHEQIWRGRDRSESEVASGVYFYRLRTPSKVLVQRMTLLR